MSARPRGSRCYPRPVVGAAVLSVAVAGCTSWHATPPSSAPGSSDAATIRVTTANGSVLIIHQPRVRNDSLVGWSRPPRESRAETVAVSLGEVQRLARRSLDPLKAVGLLAGGYLAAQAVLVLILGLTFYGG